MQLTRDGTDRYRLTNFLCYGQDTITHGRATLQLGIRYDYNHDQALASSVSANPLRPDILAALDRFAGADPGVKFNNFSPRLGFTYNIDGDRQDDRPRELRVVLGPGRNRRHRQSGEPGDPRQHPVSVG